MTESDVIWEFRQITAMEEELRTGKSASEGQTFVDDSYGQFLRSQGITPEMLESHGLNGHG